MCHRRLSRLQRDASPNGYAAFVGRPRPQQPVWEKMENLILLFVHHIDLNHDKAVGDKEVRRFIRRAGAGAHGLHGAAGLVSMHSTHH